jgi:hypothetical protein
LNAQHSFAKTFKYLQINYYLSIIIVGRPLEILIQNTAVIRYYTAYKMFLNCLAGTLVLGPIIVYWVIYLSKTE